MGCSQDKPETAQDTSGKFFSIAELDQIVAPIALYPDSLLAQVLMASTYPADIADAARWSQEHSGQEGDQAVLNVQDKPWDVSVMSLVAFPQVLDMMHEEPGWVQNLGDAFLTNPDGVMDAVQRLRLKAREQGNLETNEQQIVKVEEPIFQQPIVKIEPANPQIVYVPAYNPTIVYGAWSYPQYQPFYYSPPPNYGFTSALVSGVGFGLGVAITHSLWGDSHWGHGHKHGHVKVKVEHYNNININHRLNINKGNFNWRHKPEHRRGVPYRNKQMRELYNKPVGDISNRQEYRGREINREQALARLEDRGINPANERLKLKGVEGNKIRQRVNHLDREQVKSQLKQRNKVSEKRLQNKQAISRPVQNSGQRDQARNILNQQRVDPARANKRVVNKDRMQRSGTLGQNTPNRMRNKNIGNSSAINNYRQRSVKQNRSGNNALINAGQADRTRRNIDRGRMSNRSMQKNSTRSSPSGSNAGRRR